MPRLALEKEDLFNHTIEIKKKYERNCVCYLKRSKVIVSFLSCYRTRSHSRSLSLLIVPVRLHLSTHSDICPTPTHPPSLLRARTRSTACIPWNHSMWIISSYQSKRSVIWNIFYVIPQSITLNK